MTTSLRLSSRSRCHWARRCCWTVPALPAVAVRCYTTTPRPASGEAPVRPLPVGIFIDLDNVQPARHGREDARAFVEPLRVFGSAAGTLSTVAAFANSATLRWASPDERVRRATMLDDAVWDAASGSTGRDSDGVLRCGVCSAKMKDEHKLRKHMKLHSREQSKRVLRSQRKPVKGNERKKLHKYTAAQVGVHRHKRRNDLFTVLREEGVSCSHADDVDAALARAAKQWISELPNITPRAAGDARGCIVVVSEDADFVPLLLAARDRHHMLTVSATLRSAQQTKGLCQASDLVLQVLRGAVAPPRCADQLTPPRYRRRAGPSGPLLPVHADEHAHVALGNLLVSAQTPAGHGFLRLLSKYGTATVL